MLFPKREIVDIDDICVDTMADELFRLTTQEGKLTVEREKVRIKRNPSSSWCSSSRTPSGPPTPLPSGTATEACIDDEGLHGSWFAAAVLNFEPTHCYRSPMWYTVEYAHLLIDVEGVLVEPFATLSPNLAANSTSASAVLQALLPALHAIHLVLSYLFVWLGLLGASRILSISWWVIIVVQFIFATKLFPTTDGERRS
jgi:hypothetical protein